MILKNAQIEDLFHQYRDELFRRLSAMVKSPDTAADLLQETYTRLLRLANTKPVEQPRALLHRIATNLAIDHLRAHKGGPNTADPLDEAMHVRCPLPSQEQEVLGKERFHAFVHAVEKLPPRTKEAFLLHRVTGCSYREIAHRMGISHSGVDKHIRRAIEKTYAAVEALHDDE